MGYSPRGHKKSDTTERLTHTHIFILNISTCSNFHKFKFNIFIHLKCIRSINIQYIHMLHIYIYIQLLKIIDYINIHRLCHLDKNHGSDNIHLKLA